MKSKKRIKSEERVKVFIIPGGQKPERKTQWAVGYDLETRAIVGFEFDEHNTERRVTYFDFAGKPKDAKARKRVRRIKNAEGKKEWVWVLPPKGRCVIATGIAMETPRNLCWYVYPRTSTAFNGITVASADAPGDPDFRGEPIAVLINDSSKPFIIRYGQRLVQLVFKPAVRPKMVVVKNHADLGKTHRGCGCNGSTGH